mmetsp:Transcript_13315/g.33500  ORF Transcript_13315/g.33500 Transcript_13315/m.33500 type:complete len:518 (+) Transcript_13315:144-1697(+)
MSGDFRSRPAFVGSSGHVPVGPDGGRERPLDDLIAQDFNNLSFHDRNAINEEIHGVSSLSPIETPQMVADAIHRLSMEIDAIGHKPSYDRSQQWNSNSSTMGIDCTQSIYNYNTETFRARTHSTYVNTLDFRLRFLRADLFDAKKAARRLIKFLDVVMDLYDGNDELLRRPIGLNDLKSKEEKDYLKLGNHQLLPFRDRSGRRVVAMVPDMENIPCVRLRSKVFLYLWFVASDNEETQKKGIVLVAWPRLPENKASNSRFVPKPSVPYWWRNFIESVPIRICAFHFCIKNGGQFFKIVFATIGAALTKERIRMKIHTGDRTEISYQLLGYGIPVDLMPLTDSGNVKTKNFTQWLKVRRAMEDTRNQSGHGISNSFMMNNIECPGLNDVIFRSGKNHMSHPGNVMFQGIIESKHDEHCAAHQDDKAVITWWVIEQVESKGGCFLEWNDHGMWSQIMDRGHIRSKVSSCFRTFRRKLNAFKNRQQSDSSTSNFTHQDGSNKRRKIQIDHVGSCADMIVS